MRNVHFPNCSAVIRNIALQWQSEAYAMACVQPTYGYSTSKFLNSGDQLQPPVQPSHNSGNSAHCCNFKWPIKVPLKSNFPSIMFERFLKVHAVFTYLPKFGFDTSKGSHIFRTGKGSDIYRRHYRTVFQWARRQGYNLEEVTSDSQLTKGTWLISHTKPLYPSMLL